MSSILDIEQKYDYNPNRRGRLYAAELNIIVGNLKEVFNEAVGDYTGYGDRGLIHAINELKTKNLYIASGTNTLTLTSVYGPTEPVYIENSSGMFNIKPTHDNTGNVTIKISGGSVTKQLLKGGAQLPSGFLKAGHVYTIEHDKDNNRFNMVPTVSDSAMTLDDVELSSEAIANTVVKRDANADINTRLFRSEYTSTNANVGYIMTQIETGTGDNYIRPTTPAQLVAKLPAQNLLDRIKTVDGAGSGLDADRVDGLTSSQFLRSDVNDYVYGMISATDSKRTAGMYGYYSSSKRAHIWSIGTAYKIADDGSDFGNSYGLAYQYTSAMADGHQIIVLHDGEPNVALGQNIWARRSLSIGGTTPAGNLNNGKAIAIGDSDTGIRQNGDGVLEFFRNDSMFLKASSNGVESLNGYTWKIGLNENRLELSSNQITFKTSHSTDSYTTINQYDDGTGFSLTPTYEGTHKASLRWLNSTNKWDIGGSEIILVSDTSVVSTANKLVKRDSHGYVSAEIYRQEYVATNSTIGYIMTQRELGDSSKDNYLRPATPAQLVNGLPASNLLTKIKSVDGSGSGLDADLLDGLHAGQLAQRYAEGAIEVTSESTYANWRVGYSRMVKVSGSDAGAVPSNESSFWYIKKHAFRDVDGGYGVLALSYDGGIAYMGTSGEDSNYPVWVRIATANASGGINADTLDDLDSLRYFRFLENMTDATWDPKSSWTRVADLQSSNSDANSYIALSGKSSGKLHFVIDGEYYANEGDALVWNSNNDGSGSGLDADKLDGQHGSYYRNASNINAGTISDARLPGTITSNITGNAARLTIFDTRDDGDVKPDTFVDRTAIFSFTDEIVGSPNTWDSVITVKGWQDGYKAWQLLSNASNDDSGNYDLYFRTGKGTAWNSLARVWNSRNDGSGSGLDADKVDGLDAWRFLRSDTNDNISGIITATDSKRSAGMYGYYDSGKIGHVWSIGAAYKIEDDGSDFGGLYGIAYKHTNNTTGGDMARGHQYVICDGGTPKVSLGDNIWAKNSISVGGAIPGGSLANNKSIAIGDSDTGIRQNGDGVLEFFRNDSMFLKASSNGVESLNGYTWKIGLNENRLELSSNQITFKTSHSTDSYTIINQYDNGAGFSLAPTYEGTHKASLRWLNSTNKWDIGGNEILTSAYLNKFTTQWTIASNSGNTTDRWYKVTDIAGGQNQQFKINFSGSSSYTSGVHNFGGVMYLEIGNGSSDDEGNLGIDIFTDGPSGASEWRVVKGSDEYHFTIYLKTTGYAGIIAEMLWNSSTKPVMYTDTYTTTDPGGVNPSSRMYANWNSRNDGTGSGLDADKVDGLHAASFLRSDANDSLSGLYRFTNTHDVSLTSDGAITIGANNATNLSMDNNEIQARNNGAASTLYLNSEGGGVYINDALVWHADNDGHGTGLNADLLDGYHGTQSLLFKGTIGNDVDLNIYTTAGLYHQGSNANADGGSNYPEELAGMLTVTNEGSMVYQTYQVYSGGGGKLYKRGKYQDTWSSWDQIATVSTIDDTFLKKSADNSVAVNQDILKNNTFEIERKTNQGGVQFKADSFIQVHSGEENTGDYYLDLIKDRDGESNVSDITSEDTHITADAYVILGPTLQNADTSLSDTYRFDKSNLFVPGVIKPYSTKLHAGMYGEYNSNKIGHVWSMGSQYHIPADGSDFGTLYGIAYKHTNNSTGGTMGGGHQIVFAWNGTPSASIGTNIWAKNSISVGGAIPNGNLANNKSIAIGDSDTGIRQNGNGVLEFYQNNTMFMKALDGAIDSLNGYTWRIGSDENRLEFQTNEIKFKTSHSTDSYTIINQYDDGSGFDITPTYEGTNKAKLRWQNSVNRWDIGGSYIIVANDISTSNVNWKIAQRNGDGDINTRLFRSEYTTTNANVGYIMTQVETGTGNNYIRPSTPAQVVAKMAVISTDGNKDMDSGYTPQNDMSVATKKYVDDNGGSGGSGNLKSDGSVEMDSGYDPSADLDIATKKYVDDNGGSGGSGNCLCSQDSPADGDDMNDMLTAGIYFKDDMTELLNHPASKHPLTPAATIEISISEDASWTMYHQRVTYTITGRSDEYRRHIAILKSNGNKYVGGWKQEYSASSGFTVEVGTGATDAVDTIEEAVAIVGQVGLSTTTYTNAIFDIKIVDGYEIDSVIEVSALPDAVIQFKPQGDLTFSDGGQIKSTGTATSFNWINSNAVDVNADNVIFVNGGMGNINVMGSFNILKETDVIFGAGVSVTGATITLTERPNKSIFAPAGSFVNSFFRNVDIVAASTVSSKSGYKAWDIGFGGNHFLDNCTTTDDEGDTKAISCSGGTVKIVDCSFDAGTGSSKAISVINGGIIRLDSTTGSKNVTVNDISSNGIIFDN